MRPPKRLRHMYILTIVVIVILSRGFTLDRRRRQRRLNTDGCNNNIRVGMPIYIIAITSAIRI